MESNGCFIFRRDLRTFDNTALIEATKMYKRVYCIFIMTPEQLESNVYKSNSAVQFMYESLQELQKEIVLNFFFGNPGQILNKILKKQPDIKHVFVNRDYTFYAEKRDEELKKICTKSNILFSRFEDYLLNNVNQVKTTTNTYYSIFTPYYNKAKTFKIRIPSDIKHQNFLQIPYAIELDKLKQFFTTNPYPLIKGGRKSGLKQMTHKNDYKDNRNILQYETTLLSAYIKFGCLSIREVYHFYKNNQLLIRQLYWHDFYTTLGFHEINYSKMNSRIYQPKKISWLNRDKWDKWKNGQTGFPIVDATMRQLNYENYCHNRGRLIASGFIKFMFMDWKKAELYYAQKLRDYSVPVNHYNWNWAMSFGPFSTPYFRIMNVFTQGKNYDKNAEYIKKWVPELKTVPARDIHKWNKVYSKYPNIDYPPPCVDYKIQRIKTLKLYKDINR